MRSLLSVLLLLLSGANLYASGWNDYELDIGDGYSVFRMNSMDVCIGTKGGSLILYPSDYKHVGPVIDYQMLEKYILTKNAGVNPRNLFEGDTFEDIDYTKK